MKNGDNRRKIIYLCRQIQIWWGKSPDEPKHFPLGILPLTPFIHCITQLIRFSNCLFRPDLINQIASSFLSLPQPSQPPTPTTIAQPFHLSNAFRNMSFLSVKSMPPAVLAPGAAGLWPNSPSSTLRFSLRLCVNPYLAILLSVILCGGPPASFPSFASVKVPFPLCSCGSTPWVQALPACVKSCRYALYAALFMRLFDRTWPPLDYVNRGLARKTSRSCGRW
jgi:hypothetical protein